MTSMPFVIKLTARHSTPAAGDGGLKAEPGAPTELVLTGWGAAKPGGLGVAWPPTPPPDPVTHM